MTTIERTAANGDYYQIEATEKHLTRNPGPYFSVTCTVWERRGNVPGKARANAGSEVDAGGCMHAEILALVPELEPVVRVHLAWADGTPMHARANGWYFYSGKASAFERDQVASGHDYGYSRLLETSDHDRAARALNIAPELLPRGLDEVGFNAFVDSLADTWFQQAQKARDVIAAFEAGALP